jgi:frataxin
MSTNEQEFSALAGATIERMADSLDEAVGDRLDVDLQGGILTLTLADRSQYVINQHAPNREIWLSSPQSGGWHFSWDGAAWVSTRPPPAVLGTLLAEELGRRLGVAVTL